VASSGGPPPAPPRGSRLAGRVGEGVSEFVSVLREGTDRVHR
jgi:hypothetical protein